ncbi:MAG: hypothetical protein PHD43_20820 [Methylococcales bacterium]|nr:hypothetical protein [Methylococcales bacterium]
MRTLSTIVSRADLLRALVLAEHDPAAADRLANVLDFHSQASDETVDDILIAPPENKTKLPRQAEQPQSQGTGNAPLQCSFLTITACEPMELSSQTVSLPVAGKGLAKHDCEPLASGSPPMPLLVRKQRVWPAVKSSLVTHRSSGIDLQRLTAQIVQAEPVSRLPTLWKQWWGGELVVIWDRSEQMAPYEMDYRSLLKQIVDSRGCAGLKVYQVDGLPRASDRLLASPSCYR